MAVWRPRRDWLLEAVQSALDQGDCNLELLVVDDGSEEPVAALLAGVGDRRLRVVRVEHGGVSRARSAGRAAAKGEFVRFIDGDDVVAAGSTARLLRLATARPGTIAYGATTFCDERMQPRWTMTSRLQGSVARDCLLGRFTVRLVSMLFPAAVLDATGDWDPSFPTSQDWEYILRALEHASVLGETATATFYRKHPSSSTGNVERGLEAARRIVGGYFERHPEERGTALERRAAAHLDAMAARVYLTRRLPREAAGPLVRSLARDPGALVGEAMRSVPAVRGRLASRLGRWHMLIRHVPEPRARRLDRDRRPLGP